MSQSGFRLASRLGQLNHGQNSNDIIGKMLFKEDLRFRTSVNFRTAHYYHRSCAADTSL